MDVFAMDRLERGCDGGRDADGAELMDLSGAVWRDTEDDDHNATAGAQNVPSLSTSFILVSPFSTTVKD